MEVTPVSRVKRRLKEVIEEIASLQEERERLEAFLEVHNQFSRPELRFVSGKEIDALCQFVLRRGGRPMTPAQLVNQLKKQFGAVIDAASPARLVSTRMSALDSVESTESGWRLVAAGIELETETFK